MAQARLARGEAPPEAWTSKPQLPIDLAPVWNAFWLLSTFRGSDMLRSPPLSVVDVLEVHEVPREQRARWLRLLAILEQTFVAEMLKPKPEEPSDNDPA